LRRTGQQLLLSIEHRAAAGRDRLPLVLKDHPPALALEVLDQQPPPAPRSCRERVEQILADAGPLTLTKIRAIVRKRTSDVSQALAALVAEGRIIKSAAGYQARPSA
jgi:hypothetical protein